MKLSVIGPSVQQVTHRFLHELLLELYGQKGVFALRWSLRLSGFVTNLFACVLIVCSWCSNSFSLTQSSPINNTVILMGKMTSVLRHIPKTIVLVLKEMKCLTTCRAASPPRLWNYIGPLCWNKKKKKGPLSDVSIHLLPIKPYVFRSLMQSFWSLLTKHSSHMYTQSMKTN